MISYITNDIERRNFEQNLTFARRNVANVMGRAERVVMGILPPVAALYYILGDGNTATAYAVMSMALDQARVSVGRNRVRD